MSLVLVCGGGLFIRTFQGLTRTYGEGMDVNHILRFRLDTSALKYDDKRIALLQEGLLERINAVPGVLDTTISRADLHAHPGFIVVRPNFLKTLGIPILAGRSGCEQPIEYCQRRDQ